MRVRPPGHCPRAELDHAPRDSAARLAVARARRRSSLRGCQPCSLSFQTRLDSQGRSFRSAPGGRVNWPQSEAAEDEDLSGEKSLTLDGIVVDDQRSHRA